MPARPRLFKAIVLTSLLIAAAVLALTLSPVRLHANPASLTLFGRINPPSGWGFTASSVASPGPDIVVSPGETVSTVVNSGDGIPHNWGVDYNGDGVHDTGEPLSNDTASSTPYTFTATNTPGIYTYWCFIHKGPMHGRFMVTDFSITPNPSSLTINQGLSHTSSLTVSSLNGFMGMVSFSPPSTPTGITTTLSTSSVPVTPSTPGTTTLNITVGGSTTPGQYTVSITGSGGGNTHTANVAVNVVGPDFAISLAQSSLSIVLGSSGTSTITLTSQNGFVGSVSLMATVSPSGPTLSFNPVTVSLTSGGSATSTLSVATSSGLYSSTATGTYTVTVTASGNPSVSHSLTLSAVVTSQSSSPAASNLPVSVLVITGVAILAIVLVVAYAVLRKKPGK